MTPGEKQTGPDTPSSDVEPQTQAEATRPSIQLSSSPHLSQEGFTTRRMMIDVLIALAPAVLVAIFVFHWYAVIQIGLCVLGCVGAEAAFNRLGRKPLSIGDWSAVVTGVILGLSLPWSAPWYVAVIGSVVAIGLGKVVFGGLGFNIFNPAMVGRAFVMLSFAKQMGASAYIFADSSLTVVTRATPLSFVKELASGLTGGKIDFSEVSVQLGSADSFFSLLIGNVNGSLGETSALALLIGGIYLCVRRVASWEIPLSIIVTTLVCVELGHLLSVTPVSSLHHVISGALLLGAFFIATDPVTSPVTFGGKLLFGAGIGLLIVVIRLFSGYPEGVMFAVLVMNAAVPLLNRWTIPKPFGGPPPQRN